MVRYVVRTFFVILIAGAVGTGIGCGKAKSKFKPPDIKMITSEYVLAAAAPRDSLVWMVGDHGIIYHSTDEGKTWAEQHSGVGTLLCDVVFLDDKNGWISGIKGVMLHTSDGGATWKRQDPGTQRHLLAVSFVDRQYGWAVGEYCTIVHTSDGGTTWHPQSRELDSIYNDVFFTDRDNGWVIGETGTILHTVNGGADWKPVQPDFFKRETLEEEYENPRPTLFGMYFSDRDHGWMCGLDSTIIHTADGGTTWKVLNTGTDILYNIAVKGDRGWAVGNQGVFFMSRDGGITWELQQEKIKSKLLFANLAFSGPRKGWITGASGTVVRTTDGGDSWTFYSGLSYETEWFKMPEGLEKRIIE